MEFEITECRSVDPGWIAARAALWPEATALEHERDAGRLLARGRSFIVLLARSPEGVLGFAEALIRTDPVNGCETTGVAFLEGLRVAPAFRRQGVARALIGAIERWARERGATELASDAGLGNAEGHAVHLASGFRETERVVYFRKRLG